MDKDNSFRISAIKPTQIAAVSYAVIKQVSWMFEDGNGWLSRLIISVFWLLAVFLIPNIKGLTKRQLTMSVLIITIIQEFAFYISVGGDAFILPFLIGCALLSIMYADKLAIIVTSVISCTLYVFCVFFLNINTMGHTCSHMDYFYNVLSLVMLCFVIFLIGKYTIGTLAKTRREAEVANECKSNFLATMSHEIRTPMNAILGITQMELQDRSLPDKNKKSLEKIYTSGNILLGIINDILDMSKIETGKMELNPIEYDVPSLIHDSTQLNIMRIGSKAIDFHVDVDKNLPSRMVGDELRIKQILNNLLSNAFKYTEKGNVTLSVNHVLQGGDIALRFSVEDTGQGITPEDLKKLFTEYTRFNTDSNQFVEGTGIGLSITKNLVELMGGSITVESEYGKGSTFTVTIIQKAVACEPIGAEVAEKLNGFAFSGKKERRSRIREIMPYGKVLVVDDVDTNLYVAQGLMSPYQLQIETAISGFAAIEMLENTTYDVVFMDHMMPKMDGIETTKNLRKGGYKGTIIALTANALVGNAEMFMQSGFDDFLSKPIDVRQLNSILNKWVRDKHPEEAKKYAGKTVQSVLTQKDPKLLEVFCKDAEKAAVTLRDTAANGDIRQFTVIAHAMKSALLNIGEKEKSELAEALETAGNNGDTEYISANTENFIEILQALITKHAPAETADDSEVTEDTAFLKEQLAIIKAACEEYDEKTAYTAIDLLKEKQWKKETLTAIEEIRDILFLSSDFEKAAEQIDKLNEESYLCKK